MSINDDKLPQLARNELYYLNEIVESRNSKIRLTHTRSSGSGTTGKA